MKVIYCNVHFDKCHNIFEWLRKLPIDIKFYVCFDKEFECDPINQNSIHEDFPKEMIALKNIDEIINILDINTLVIGFSNHFELLDSKCNISYKKAIFPSGNYSPPEGYYFLTHSKKYLNKYNNKNNGLYVPKIYNTSFNFIDPEKRKNYYSYIRYYEKMWPDSYKQFSKLHNVLKNHGITLVNYGFQKDKMDCEYDVSQKIYTPVSKATIHIKCSDNVSNSVCKSIYYETPVLMLKRNYENNWFDSIEGIYTFNDIEDMSNFILKMENDFLFYNNILKETKLAKCRNNNISDDIINNSIKWLNNL